MSFKFNPITGNLDYYESASTSTDATSIQGFNVTTTDPTDGKILVYRTSTSEYVLEDKPTIVFSYNGDVALEYTGDDITKITKNVDGTITETDLAYEYTGGLLTKLTKTKDGVSKYKTLTYTGGVLTNISAWEEV